MSRSPSLPDRPRLDLDPDMSTAERLDAIRKHFVRLVEVNEELDERLAEATDRRSELQEEVSQLKERNEALKTSALYIASVEELTDDESVIIKQHGNNQEVLTEVSPQLYEEMENGDRVAINETSATTISAVSTSRSGRSARLSKTPSRTPHSSMQSALSRRQVCCSTGHRGPARRCWRRPSPTRATLRSSR